MVVIMRRYMAWVVWLILTILTCGFPALAQSQQPDQRLSGSINGTVVDQTGAVVAGAPVKLSREDQSPNQEVLSGDDGQFSFADIAPGPFQLTITVAGFATQTFSGILHSEEIYVVPQTTLAVAAATTEVRVVPSRTEVAVDPITFGVNGVIAGVQQARNDFSGYGQGAQGYAKRYAASYGDFVASTIIGSAILPSLLKQDPRYFYKGSGIRRSRILYAIANSVICKSDAGQWQANYSSILGSFAAGGISNLYYPTKDRNGAGLTLENGLIGIGESATINLLQEFFVRKLTPDAPNHEPAEP